MPPTGTTSMTMRTPVCPRRLWDQVLHDGDYTGMTNLDGVYPERRYVAALPVAAMTLSGRTVVEGLVLVSADASSLAEMWSAMAHHLLLLRRGGAHHLCHRQHPHLRPPGPALK